MTEKSKNMALALFILASVAGCATNPKCESEIENASYTGAYRGTDNNLNAYELNRDITCATVFRDKKYPSGFVTIYGSSRIGENNSLPDSEAARENDAIYELVMSFAEEWTSKNGAKYPIMTGAGPGVMEAGSRGAMKAGGPSIGYTTYYDPEPRGDAAEAFWTYNGQKIITDGLVFSSVAIREYSMILHSAAYVIAPGGTGTEWETYQILESLKSNQLNKAPVYFIGNKEAHWKSFYIRLNDMVRRGTIKDGEVTRHIVHIEKASDLVERLERDLLAAQP